ncbi:hypothetical protein [Hymenobacter profundi]|uniref:Uncharacterized protein n=1 Tax=Hymenobacter profundi TaxID=1982110 RepID=A0ABS6WYY8_9BACT|nr:hypothetical protein [Hymenobacter profundi]MBW3128808.1 hypothetical protein [Hymenobacter profundi]
MNKLYIHLAGVLLAATSLTSCNKSQYAFKPTVSPYHVNTTQKRVAVVTEEPKSASAALAETHVSSDLIIATSATQTQFAKPNIKGEKPSFKAVMQKPGGKVRQMAVAGVFKQLRKPLAQHNEVSKVRRGMSSAGRAGIIIGIGAVILLIGGLIGGTNFVATIGGIVFLVGVVLLIIALINGR